MRTACPFHTAEVHEWSNSRELVAEIGQRARLVDIVLILLVPYVLVALHTLPAETRLAFAFDLRNPTLVTAYTSSFLHFDWSHLLGNLVAYLLIVPVAYLLSVLSNRRRHFLAVFGAVLGVCPFVISAAHLPLQARAVTMGFSGLAMALYGYASLIFVGFLSTRLTTGLHLDHAPLVFFAQIAAIALVVAPPTRTVQAIVTVSLGFVTLSVLNIVRTGELGGGLIEACRRVGYDEVAVLSVLIMGFFMAIGFSGDTNNFAHFLGYASGFILSYIVLRADCSLSHVLHCAGPEGGCRVHDSWDTRLLGRLLGRFEP
jgi:membrane associated rhomboid family serine protease